MHTIPPSSSHTLAVSPSLHHAHTPPYTYIHSQTQTKAQRQTHVKTHNLYHTHMLHFLDGTMAWGTLYYQRPWTCVTGAHPQIMIKEEDQAHRILGAGINMVCMRHTDRYRCPHESSYIIFTQISMSKPIF